MYFLNHIPTSTIMLQILVIFQLTPTFSLLFNYNDNGKALQPLLEESIKIWLQNPSSSKIWTQCTILIVYTTEADNIHDDNNIQIIIPTDNNDVAVFLTKSFDKNLHQNPKVQPLAYHQHFSTPCTIAYYLIPLKYFGLFHKDFINGLPGGTFASFHILYLLEDDVKSGVYKTFHDELITQELIVGIDKDNEKPHFRFIKQLHHFVIVENKLYTYNLWFNQTIILKDQSKGRNNNEISFKSGQSLLFPDKWHNLNGGALAIAAIPDTNIVNPVDDYIRTKEVQSISAAGGVEILRYFNATPIFTKKSPIFGHKDINGKWIGLIGAVLDGTSHIAFGVGGSPERASVVSYSHAYHFDKVIFITSLSKQTTAGSIGSLNFLSRPLHGLVWLIITLIFLIIYCLLLYKKYLQEFHKSSKYLALTLLNILLRPIFDQPNQTPSLQSKLRDLTTRLLLSQWLLAIIVLSCSYKSNFISILLAPTIIHPPKTFDELLVSRTDYKIGSIVYNESYMASSFAALNNSIGIEIVKRVRGYPLQSSEGYLAIENFDSQQICMGISAFIESGATYYLTGSNGMPLYKVSEDSLFPTTGSIVVPKHFPHLLETLNVIIDRFVQTGIISNFVTLEKRYKAKEGSKLSHKIRSTSKDEDKELDQGLNHFLTILIVCYVISSSVLLLEILKYYVVDKLNLMRTKVKKIKK